MAYCGKCGHQNNDDARFCGACGAPLKKADKSGGVWADMAAKKKEAEKRPVKVKSKGCLKRILWWMIGLAVFFVLWTLLVKACSDEGGGGEGDNQEVKQVENSSSGLLSKDDERSFDDARFEKLHNRHKFPLSTVDVSLQPGEYTAQLEKDGVKGDLTLKIEPTESDNKKILGRAEFTARVEGKGEGSQTLTVTYAGHSVYALYTSEDDIGSLDGMAFFVSPDGKTLDCYDHGEIIMSFKLK